ncbi:hypothetical protein LIER_06076 [Lithospermum erythrorhizon]|uniref:C2H2-type domain-containing protein n=1 Tax=Lithospermum erythrorhizon TaxID=34254 RepID=A0AAV3P707_LITER
MSLSQPPETITSTTVDGGAEPLTPFKNFAIVQSKMDNLHKFLSNSVNTNTLITKDQMEMVNGEITAAIHQIIVNGSALLMLTQPQMHPLQKMGSESETINQFQEFPQGVCENASMNLITVKSKIEEYGVEDSCEIVELDAVELLAEHIHFCEVCGKGFKRDANLRMHMRAHGNQFKTPEALAKPEVEKCLVLNGRKTRFSCPFVGCNRNKKHKKFRPLKSVVCVKNHFKRSHCPKMYSCTMCNKKSFSVLADLKSHLKHCGETKWKCSCGTNFSRKDKLFGHMALFEGHMPTVMEEGKEVSAVVTHEEDEVEEEEDNDSGGKDVEMGKVRASYEDDNGGLFDGLIGGFESVDNYSFQDILNSANGNELGSEMDDFFNF